MRDDMKRLPYVSAACRTTRRIPGTPRDIPTDATVIVLERLRSKGATRYRVLFDGASYWVDPDAIEVLQP